MTAEELARLFHETYERLAPTFGYETREDSAKPWEQVPDTNRRLMVAVAADVLARISPGSGETPRSAMEAADNLIAALVEPAAFWRAFKSVKFETVDTEDGAGGRVIVIVAKSEAADLISDAYDEAVKDLPEGDRDAVT